MNGTISFIIRQFSFQFLTVLIFGVSSIQVTAVPPIVWIFVDNVGYGDLGCFGKWNLGFAPGSRPLDRGFDEYFGTISGNADYYTYIYNGRNDLYRNNEPANAEGYSTDVIAEAACDFIERHQNQPFFCYIPFNAAHYPNPRNKPAGTPAVWQAPDSAFERYGYSPNTLDEEKRYQAVITAMDDGVGKILDQLDNLKLSKKTFLVFLSDNGAFMIPARGMECASNKPFRSGGSTLWEGAIRQGNFKLLKEKESTNKDWQLFNLEKDPGETSNIAARYPDLTLHLRTQWENWNEQID